MDSLPMSLEFDNFEEDIELKMSDDEILTHWLENINMWIESGVYLNDTIIEYILPLEINFSKFTKQTRKEVIKLFTKLLKYYDLQLLSKPVRIEDITNKKDWIKKDSSDYNYISRILAFLILSGMWKLSYEFLKKLLDLHKRYPDKITTENFKKWNEIVGIYI